MRKNTQNLRFPLAVLAPVLEALVTATPVQLAADVVRLYNADPGIPLSPVLGDFVEADFDGYAAADIATPGWDGAVNLSPSKVALVTQQLFVAGAGIAADQNVAGYYITNTAGDTLIAWEPFDENAGFSKENDYLELNVFLSWDTIWKTGGFA